ncbi:MAG: UPF0316 protein [Anaerolineaceae bacterium]|nr:DUF2179 domain-containing protein [Chloroflexota bacterium]MBV6466120.1 hypothetical protein [Anaerolineales bacterium]GJQ40155.1 MAG: UPF0316 protein [Anaerolineaceae bacterium]NOG76317.1 DUF2179 domain-containing protein [Chloroflexota bacterium]GIK10424.1 MAG: UPF0316 protein [Chloroflexota bacterium]
MIEFDWNSFVFLPLLVFAARIADVTLGTIRIIFTSRGRKTIAPLLGFVEVFIWVSVIAEVTRGAHNIVAYLAYAAGFAGGTFAGIWIEERMAIGSLVIRAILPESQAGLEDELRAAGYGVTSVDAHGGKGPVKLVYTIVNRKDLPNVIEAIHKTHPKTFFTVEELRSVEQGVFPVRLGFRQDTFFGRKSK